jgi:hypothetical protein
VQSGAGAARKPALPADHLLMQRCLDISVR